MINKIRALHPDANITPVDYDPSATRVNQENRIKLMLAVAREKLDQPARYSLSPRNSWQAAHRRWRRWYDKFIKKPLA